MGHAKIPLVHYLPIDPQDVDIEGARTPPFFANAFGLIFAISANREQLSCGSVGRKLDNAVQIGVLVVGSAYRRGLIDRRDLDNIGNATDDVA